MILVVSTIQPRWRHICDSLHNVLQWFILLRVFLVCCNVCARTHCPEQVPETVRSVCNNGALLLRHWLRLLFFGGKVVWESLVGKLTRPHRFKICISNNLTYHIWCSSIWWESLVGKFGCGIYGFIAALWYRLLCLVGKLCGKVVWESCLNPTQIQNIYFQWSYQLI